MTQVWALAALWLGLALIATLLSIWLRVSTALSEIVVGTIAQLIIGALVGSAVLGTDESWIRFLSGTGAIVLTFLAGAELDPQVFKLKWKEAGAVGLTSFFLPFLGCAAAAYYLLGWGPMQSWLAGVALSPFGPCVVPRVFDDLITGLAIARLPLVDPHDAPATTSAIKTIAARRSGPSRPLFIRTIMRYRQADGQVGAARFALRHSFNVVAPRT